MWLNFWWTRCIRTAVLHQGGERGTAPVLYLQTV